MQNILEKVVFCLLVVMMACQPSAKIESMQKQIDSLKSRTENSFRPGFGEFMTGIQAQHEKLWFAGKNRNWKLAEFEIHEMEETLEAIEKFRPERKETPGLVALEPMLESLKLSVQSGDSVSFNSGFILLTKQCNSCHQAYDFGFNVVKVPDQSSFRNQEFKVALPH